MSIPPSQKPTHRLVVWGTYDLSKPRVRLLLQALEILPLEVYPCHGSIWEAIRDKSQLSAARVIGAFLRIILTYPKLIYRYLRTPKHDAVLIPFMGHLDIWVLWPIARLRGVPIIWDVFISLYDTVVCDRRKWRPESMSARLLFWFEKTTFRLASKAFSDTAHGARYLEQLYHLPSGRVDYVWVGVEAERFPILPPRVPQEVTQVLFYGQFIPLHGIGTIVAAAEKLAEEALPIQFTLIGTGQEADAVDAQIKRLDLSNITRVLWVDYERLIDALEQADICLGIFGTSNKAHNVIPNKVFQILATGRPLITADTPAIRELIKEDKGIALVPPGDADALAQAIKEMAAQPSDGRPFYTPEVVGPSRIARHFAAMLP